jgi:hypothetical protein
VELAEKRAMISALVFDGTEIVVAAPGTSTKLVEVV